MPHGPAPDTAQPARDTTHTQRRGPPSHHNQQRTLSLEWRRTTHQPQRHPRSSARIGQELPNTATTQSSREQHKATHRAHHRDRRISRKATPARPSARNGEGQRPGKVTGHAQKPTTRPLGNGASAYHTHEHNHQTSHRHNHRHGGLTPSREGGRTTSYQPPQNHHPPPHPAQGAHHDRHPKKTGHRHTPPNTATPLTNQNRLPPPDQANSNSPGRQNNHKRADPHKARPQRQRHTALNQHDTPSTQQTLTSNKAWQRRPPRHTTQKTTTLNRDPRQSNSKHRETPTGAKAH